MKSKLLAFILQLPLIFLVVASFFASIYAAVKHIGGIGYATSALLGIILLFFFLGRYLENKFNRRWEF